MKPEMKLCEYGEAVPEGKVYAFSMVMTPYPDKRTRRIRVWLPAAYDGKRRFPVIYMHDGQNVIAGEGDPLNKLYMDRAVSVMAKEYGLSAIVVAVDTSDDRGAELTPPYERNGRGVAVNGFHIPIIDEKSSTDLYARFIVEDLKPVIDDCFLTLPDVMNTYVGGISAGGSASYYMILEYPEVFGRAIVMSPGFPMFSMEALLKMLDGYDMSRLEGHRIAFYNGDQGIDVTSVDYVLAVYRKLKALGMDEKHCMFLLDTRQTHYETAWAKWLPEMLRFLMPEDNSQPGPRK